MSSSLARTLHSGARHARMATAHAAHASLGARPLLGGRQARQGGVPCGCRAALRRRGRGAAQLQVVASWNADIEWSPATIVKTSTAAKGHQALLLDVGAAATERYTKAGQYLQVRVGDSKPGFFAIASAPGGAPDGTVELLVRRRDGTAEALCTAAEGAAVEASPIGGPGFRVEQIPPEAVSHVFIFATGTGISPIKALLESGTLQAERREKVKLFWGTHDEESTAYKADVERWRAAGVEVVSVFSTAGRGYVQDVFEKENEVQDGSRVGVILCGHKEMAQALTAQFESLGVPKDRILLNF